MARNVSLICPHTVRSNWMIHDQIHIVYKYTFNSICQFICSFHQSLSIHHVFHDKQSLVISSHCSSVLYWASKQSLLNSIASSLMKTSNKASCLRPVKQPKIIKLQNLSQWLRSTMSYRDDYIDITIKCQTRSLKWCDNCSVTFMAGHGHKQIPETLSCEMCPFMSAQISFNIIKNPLIDQILLLFILKVSPAEFKAFTCIFKACLIFFL